MQLVEQAQSWGVPFHTIVADAGYGIPSFLRVFDERHLSYVCAVASDFGVRLPTEMEQATEEPEPHRPRGRGQPRKPRPARRYDASSITAAQPDEMWQTVTWREGSRDPCRSSLWRFAFTLEPVVPAIVKRTDAVGRDQKAGCLASARCQGKKVN